CSYRRTTLFMCSVNIAVALYVLYSIYSSLYVYSFGIAQPPFRYSSVQARRREESRVIRKALQPTELIRLVAELQEKLRGEQSFVGTLPQNLKHAMTDEILTALRRLDADANTTQQREAVEAWRVEKLKAAEQLLHHQGKASNSTIPHEEAGIVAKVLSSGWSNFQEAIGLWMPVEILNREHDDKPEGAEELEKEILPGRQLPPECNAELHTDYDGAAVKWGLTNPKETAYDCCMACMDQAKRAKPGENRCNVWVYCPSENGCYSPDIYEHRSQECWLKYSEAPKLNFKDRYSDSYRAVHPNAPEIVPWVSGVVS
ncbi:hypothetical protein M569_06330, partial [Genlisea aurea]